MRYLKKLFAGKSKKLVYNVILLFSVGIALLVMGRVAFPKPPDNAAQPPPTLPMTEIVTADDISYEERLEARLADILSCVENAGHVRVLLKLSHGKELVVAEDVRIEQSDMQEADHEGGTRSDTRLTTDGQTVLIRQANGGDAPLVLKEMEPRVEGALIIAEGGDDVFVKDALIRATYTVLGVEPHKVQVLKMQAQE